MSGYTSPYGSYGGCACCFKGNLGKEQQAIHDSCGLVFQYRDLLCVGSMARAALASHSAAWHVAPTHNETIRMRVIVGIGMHVLDAKHTRQQPPRSKATNANRSLAFQMNQRGPETSRTRVDESRACVWPPSTR